MTLEQTMLAVSAKIIKGMKLLDRLCIQIETQITDSIELEGVTKHKHFVLNLILSCAKCTQCDKCNHVTRAERPTIPVIFCTFTSPPSFSFLLFELQHPISLQKHSAM